MKLPQTSQNLDNLNPEEFKVVKMTTKHHKHDCASSVCPINLRRARKAISKTNPLVNVVDQRTVMRVIKYRPHFTAKGKIIWRQDKILIDNLVEAQVTLSCRNIYYSTNNTITRSALFQLLDEDGNPATDFTWAKETLAAQVASHTEDFYVPHVARPVFALVSPLDGSPFTDDSENPRVVIPDNTVSNHPQQASLSSLHASNNFWAPIKDNTPEEVYFKWPVCHVKQGYSGLTNKEYSEQTLTAHELSRLSRRLMQLGWYTKS